MKSRVHLLGHPVHQMLIAFPLGLLSTAVIFDIIHLVGRSTEMAAVAYWLILAGLVGALVAAPFGTLDWLKIPKGTRARRIGAMHGIGNGVMSLLFLASWLLRPEPPGTPGTLAFVLSFASASLSLVTAWLGGELVDRLGIGVYEDANVNAPSSLDEVRAHRST